MAEEIEREDALRAGQAVFLQVGVEAGARTAEVGDTCKNIEITEGRMRHTLLQLGIGKRICTC